MLQEPDFASVAALIGEPTRAAILSALLNGEALPATELACRAQVTAQTASSHLTKLLEGNLVQVTSVGRHRYFSLKNHEVAQILEALHVVAPLSKPKPPRAPSIPPELRAARTCYDHLAGELGVALTDALIQQAYFVQEGQNFVLTQKGIEWLESWQVDLSSLKRERRRFAYACLDWSERHFHIAGSLGAVIADCLLRDGWIRHLPHTRALKITVIGSQRLKQDFGIALEKSSNQ